MNNELCVYFKYQGYLYWVQEELNLLDPFVTGQMMYKSYIMTLDQLYQEESSYLLLSYRQFIALFDKGIENQYIPFRRQDTGSGGIVAYGRTRIWEGGRPENLPAFRSDAQFLKTYRICQTKGNKEINK